MSALKILNEFLQGQKHESQMRMGCRLAEAELNSPQFALLLTRELKAG